MDILGLPLHPLVVHLVVVALPVGALATAAAVVSPAFRTRYATLALGTLTVGALATVAAKFSGEALAETVPLPERHATLGQATVIVGLATAALAWGWWLLERRQAKAPAGQVSFATMLAGGLVATAALAVAVLTVMTGHAGAQAVGHVSTILTGAVGDVARALGGFATEIFEIRDAVRRAGHDHGEPARDAADEGDADTGVVEVAGDADVRQKGPADEEAGPDTTG